VSLVLDTSASCVGSWVRRVHTLCAPWCQGVPQNKAQWRRLALQVWEHGVARDAVKLWEECESHEQLMHYQPGVWCREGRWSLNVWVHNPCVGVVEARLVSRLLAGGQGLRAGDCCEGVDVTVANCCVFCLESGDKALENLRHVVFDCPSYQASRDRSVIQVALEKGPLVLLLHRDLWTCAELNAIRRFLCEIQSTRLCLSGGQVRKVYLNLKGRAETAWSSA